MRSVPLTHLVELEHYTVLQQCTADTLWYALEEHKIYGFCSICTVATFAAAGVTFTTAPLQTLSYVFMPRSTE